MSTKVNACNLALSRLGNYDSIEDIDTPQKPTEIVFAKWWNHARRMALKEIMPHFAMSRRILAPDATAPAFGYGKKFEYPSDCLRVLGFGEVRYKANTYAVEEGFILTDDYDTDADGNVSLSLRFIKDISDVSKFTPEFVEELTWFLAYTCNMEITQDGEKQVYLEKIINQKKATAGAISSQENPPIRVNISKFREARRTYDPQTSTKK